MRRVLFPGRFQPIHKGHLYAIEKLLKEFDEIVIAIGSAQEGFTCDNPFTASERLEMIREVMEEHGYSREKYWLIPIPDINKPLAWTTYVLSMVPKVDAVASGNPHVLGIYSWLGFRVVRIELLEPEKYSGRVIRRLIRCGGEWSSLVSQKTYEFIVSVNGVERIREVCSVEYCSDRW
ncbi:MAG: nicotinamide-nucleotide adenylyltransferase [Desulfurococcaceae archaeon]